MASKLNIFNALPNHPSDDEDDHGHKGSQSGQGGAKKDRVRTRGKKPEGTSAGAGTTSTSTASKDLKSRDHNLKKAKNDLDHPHTLDRKSGTGHQAFGVKDKKGGAGKFGKGTLKDETRGPRPEGEREEEEQSVSGEEEDNTVTFDDYEASKHTVESKQQINDAKAKITDDQIKKELGKATLLQNRKTVEVDDRTETHKKNKNATTVTGMNTEHAELLGFRTGFKVFDDKKKRPYGERTGGDKPAEKEGEKAEGAEEKKSDEKPAEETTKAEEKSPEGGQKGGRGGYRGGYKGEGRGGYKGDGGYKGGDKGGYKGGDKGGYKGGQKKPTFNAEDESLFPKLG